MSIFKIVFGSSTEPEHKALVRQSVMQNLAQIVTLEKGDLFRQVDEINGVLYAGVKVRSNKIYILKASTDPDVMADCLEDILEGADCE